MDLMFFGILLLAQFVGTSVVAIVKGFPAHCHEPQKQECVVKDETKEPPPDVVIDQPKGCDINGVQTVCPEQIYER